MALPCPQRDALEFVAERAKMWSADETSKLTPEITFRLTSGKTIHFLGVSYGTEMRRNPNLHIAVFGLEAPAQNHGYTNNLQECRFGGLITGPDDEGQLWAQGLAVVSVHSEVVELRQTKRKAPYRTVS